MYSHFFKTTGLLLLAGLLMPAGMLLATESHQPLAVTSSSANWYDVEQASNMFATMHTLSLKVRKEVARLQTQELQLNWQGQSDRLARAKNDINTIGNDLIQLNEMKSKLMPWQQSLIDKVSPEIHEMVYQTDQALKTLSNHESRVVLSMTMTHYPQNINHIYKNANQLASTISTVTQYARAEQKMEALNKMSGNQAGS